MDCGVGGENSGVKIRVGFAGQMLGGVVALSLLLGAGVGIAGVFSSGGAASAGGDPVIAAAGDIACDPSNSDFNGGQGKNGACQQLATYTLLQQIDPAAVLALGDTQYYCGGYQAFLQSYALSWGQLLSKTYPSVGNHEYLTSGGTGCDSSNQGAAGYFRYYSGAAEEGNVGQGWYSFDLANWHIIALNSNCGDAGGCSASSPQGKWLAADLAAHPSSCTLAYWHIPLFSSGGRAAPNSQYFWQSLYNAGADIVLNGHDHIYERFAPQTPSGQPDSAAGIREFIVGTGGANHTSIVAPAPNSEVRIDTAFGVLRLTLHPGSYDWAFVPVGGQPVMDSGTGTCHHATDTSPPSVPSGLSAAAAGGSGEQLSWSPSTDNVGVAGYRVLVNGSQVGSTAATSYTVTGLACGTAYQLWVEAYDAAGNVSAPATVTGSTAACSPPPLFADGFESGSLSQWSTVAGLQVAATAAHSGSYGALATSTAGTAAYALKQLASTQTSVYYSLWFKVLGQGSNVVDLAKLRTASGAALLTVFVAPTGQVGYQNNVTTLSTYSKTTASPSTWHQLEVHVVINGTAGQVQTWLDGQPIADLTKTESLGTTPIGAIQLGENITGRTYDTTFDDISVGTSGP